MRVIVVEEVLDEVLAVLEKRRQSNDSEDNGAGKDEPDKKGCSPLPLLSCRERSIIAHLMEGHSNKVIARDLNVAEPTVQSHVKHILNKIGATNRTQAAMLGRTKFGGIEVVAATEWRCSAAPLDLLIRTTAHRSVPITVEQQWQFRKLQS